MTVPGVYCCYHFCDLVLDFVEGGLYVCEAAAGWGGDGSGGEEADGEEGCEVHLIVVIVEMRRRYDEEVVAKGNVLLFEGRGSSSYTEYTSPSKSLQGQGL